MTWLQLGIGVVLYAAAVMFVLALAAISADPDDIDELSTHEFFKRVDDNGDLH